MSPFPATAIARRFRPLVAAAALGLAGCAHNPALPAGEPHYTGTLVEYLPVPLAPETGIRILLADPAADPPRDRVAVRIPRDARIRIVERDGSSAPATINDLSVGSRLRVWTTGVELRSYPAQVEAVTIHILR